ncbi:MAG: methyltransferase domain-containing protein [Bacillota bacterium]|nr:MAG: methyltransferase domain-containing protein [Bacillota bacterium]
MPALEYLHSVLEKAKAYLPDWLWKQIHQAAMPSAGGKARWREPEEPTPLEKMALADMTPDKLRKASDDEVRLAWLRLHQWYGAAKKRGEAVEPMVNAALFVMDEFERRGFSYDETSELVQEAKKLGGVRKAQGIEAKLAGLPQEVVVVPNFVCVVGSAAAGKENPEDIDILFRAQRDQSGDNFLVQAQNIWLPVRKVLDPEKSGALHYIDGPTGPHGDNVPIFDLVLRRKAELKREVVKGEALRLDLGCGDATPEGYVGIDKRPGPKVDMVHDLEQGIPYPDASADEVRANHVLEHLGDKERIMAEVWRVLKPGGRFVFEVPSTKGEGAFNHPGHRSFWNKTSFAFWTEDHLLEGRPKFEVETLEEVRNGDLVYVRGALRKPEAPATVSKGALKPIMRFEMPKPAMKHYAQTEAFKPEEVWPWVEEHLKGGVVSENKLNGFRAAVQKAGDKVSVFFEDAQEERNRQLPEVVKALEGIDADFILDANVGVEQNDRPWPRIKLMTLTADKPELPEGAYPKVTVFDIIYWDGDLHSLPFRERRARLEEFYDRYLKDDKHFAITAQMEVRSKADLERAWREQGVRVPLSEGIVLKDLSAPYTLGPSTDALAKVKKMVEVKALVLDVKVNKNGTRGFRGGLLPGVSDYTNRTEFRGKEYIDLGWSFNAPLKAEPGDVMTFEVEEIIPQDDGSLAWLGAKPVDVDKTRTEPYYANQVVDMARRGGILQKAAPQVPSAGPAGAKVAFVGASPGAVEAARREPFVGPSGETLNELYLKPLGLARSQVFLTNAVPLYLTDDRGRVREPTDTEIAEWHDWLMGELDRAGPRVVVALGQTAKKALGERADFVLPHPMAVRRFGDSGEVARKLKQVRQAMERVAKADDLEEGDTRAEVAAKWWADNWPKMFPPDGKGRYVYHHHYRGLSQDETKLDEEELLRTSHSLHGDLRFEGPDGELWGFSVFLGTTEENRKAGGDRLIALPPDDNLQGSFKLSQPKAWLDVASKKPYVSEPGGVGSTSEKYAKFFEADSGTYEIGVWREHMFEVFLHGERLKGRFLLEYAPVAGGRRVWLIDRPKDQTPYAKSHKLEDVLAELREKDQRWLVWRDPEEGGPPRKIDVTSAQGRVAKEYQGRILKADEERQLVYGVVLEPDTLDTQGDTISADEIERAAHRFLAKSRVVGQGHKRPAKAEVVESYVAPAEMEIGGQRVKKGSWIIAVHVLDPELWRAIKAGEYTGFSVGGFGTREEAA